MTKKKAVRIFYSWQSDSPAKTNLNAIRNGIDKAGKEIAKRLTELKFVRDEATRDTAGSPNIALKILEKIEQADVFIADITTVTSPGAKRPCPNPNVGYELGYAVATLGWDRVILLFNKAHGTFPDDVPFDFIQNRISDYQLGIDDGEQGQANLTNFLKNAIGAIVSKNPKRPAELRGVSKEKIEHDHDVENMNWLMSKLHLPTLDQLIDELPHMIVDKSLWFYDHCRGVVVNSLFSLYDDALDKEVERFFRAWTTVLSHNGQYRELRSGHAHVFWNPLDMPLPADREAIWNEIDGARREMRSSLDAILKRLRSSYHGVKISKTNEKAWSDYIAFMKEMGELDKPDAADRPRKKSQANRKVSKARKALKAQTKGKRKRADH